MSFLLSLCSSAFSTQLVVHGRKWPCHLWLHITGRKTEVAVVILGEQSFPRNPRPAPHCPGPLAGPPLPIRKLRRKLGRCILKQDWGSVIGENRERLVGRQYAESSLRCHCAGQHPPSRSSQSLDGRASWSFPWQSQAQRVLSCRRDLYPPLGRGCRGP